MTSLISFFKVLRCLGLFPRRILTRKESSSVFRRQRVERRRTRTSPMSPFPLLMTVIFHITMIILYIIYMYERFKLIQQGYVSAGYGNDTFQQSGRVSWSILWIWSSAFAGWFILMNNGKLIQLNNFLISLQTYQNKDEKYFAKFSKLRMLWAVSIPILRVTISSIYYYKFQVTTITKKILFHATLIEDEFLKIMIEFTFWQIAKLHQGIITREGQLTLEDISPKTGWNDLTVREKSESKLEKRDHNFQDSKNNSIENMKIFDCSLLQTESYLKSVNNCAQHAMTCFNYSIMFQMTDLVFGILFCLYFGIIYADTKRLFLLLELVFLIPRLVLLATLSGSINHEVRTRRIV